jgi:tRNA-specific 2-thiouridylase
VYVLTVDPVRNRVVVGGKREALRVSCLLADTHCHVPPQRVHGPLTARLRSSQEPVAATVREEGETVRLLFAEAQAGVAPGQSAVLYDGDIVVGGGVIRADEDGACPRPGR